MEKNILKKLAKKIVNCYYKKGKIADEEVEKYEYCFEIAISSVVNLIVILILALFNEYHLETMVFLTIFAVMRVSAGGYHSKTHFGCVVSLVVIYCLLITFLAFCKSYMNILSLGFIVVAVPIIIIYAPVDNVNKTLTQEEKKKYRKISLIKLLSVILVNMVIWLLKEYIIAFVINYTLFVVALLLLFGIYELKIHMPHIKIKGEGELK